MTEKKESAFLWLSWMKTRDKIITFVIIWGFIVLWYSFPIQRWLYFHEHTRSFVESMIPQDNRNIAYKTYMDYHREAAFTEEVTGIRLCERSQTCDAGIEVTWERYCLILWRIVGFTEVGGMGGVSRNRDYFEPGAPPHVKYMLGYSPQERLAQYPPNGIEIRAQIRENRIKMSFVLSYDNSIVENRHLQQELLQRHLEIAEHISDAVKNMSDVELAPANIDKLKIRIKAEVNRMLHHGQITEIYIADYVSMQVSEDTRGAEDPGQW